MQSFITKLSSFHSWWRGLSIFEEWFIRPLLDIHLTVRVIVPWKWLFLSSYEGSVGRLFQCRWLSAIGACTSQMNPIYNCKGSHTSICWKTLAKVRVHSAFPCVRPPTGSCSLLPRNCAPQNILISDHRHQAVRHWSWITSRLFLDPGPHTYISCWRMDIAAVYIIRQPDEIWLPAIQTP